MFTTTIDILDQIYIHPKCVISKEKMAVKCKPLLVVSVSSVVKTQGMQSVPRSVKMAASQTTSPTVKYVEMETAKMESA